MNPTPEVGDYIYLSSIGTLGRTSRPLVGRVLRVSSGLNPEVTLQGHEGTYSYGRGEGDRPATDVEIITARLLGEAL